MDKSTRLSGYIYALHLDGGIPRYIGLTTRTVPQRFQQHLYRARSGFKLPVYDWMRKHGPDNVRVTILEEVADRLDERETFHIQKAKEKYGDVLLNLSNGGEAPMSGRTHNAETRLKLSEASKRSGHLIGNTHLLGHKHSDETRKKLSKALEGNTRLLGHKHSDETKSMISNSLRGRKNRGQHTRYHEKLSVSKPDTCSYCAEALDEVSPII